MSLRGDALSLTLAPRYAASAVSNRIILQGLFRATT
jgi:hypothetical protein